MSLLDVVCEWGNRHYPPVFAVMRIILGGFLVVKGYIFLQNQAFLKAILLGQEWVNLSPGLLSFLIFVVIFVHMTGGMLIALGLFTRLAALMQIPVVTAAVLVAHLFRSSVNAELSLSVITDAGLLLFLVIGSGTFSLDHYFKTIQDPHKSNL